MNDQTYARERMPQKGKFFVIQPDIRGGGKGHGLKVANANKLAPPGSSLIDIPNGDPNQYPEKPILALGPDSGRMPRDLEGMAGIWIISERLKQVFEAIDPTGFIFVACDFRLPDGSLGPQHYLCNVARILDAVDEETSKLKIEIEPSGRKIYNFIGFSSLAFKDDVVKSFHVFRTPYAIVNFCDRALRDTCIDAGMNGLWFTDASDY